MEDTEASPGYECVYTRAWTFPVSPLPEEEIYIMLCILHNYSITTSATPDLGYPPCSDLAGNCDFGSSWKSQETWIPLPWLRPRNVCILCRG